uniref:HTH OST-type domain-containing protein n=1 Tax=Fundulus heteroclitus TaxID=8078 RepID=A0A3Q2PR31_FUNHE
MTGDVRNHGNGVFTAPPQTVDMKHLPLSSAVLLPAPLNLNESAGSGKGKPYDPQQVQSHIREILAKYSNGFWVSKLPQMYRELYKQDLPSEAIKDLESWTHICIVEKTCSSNSSELLLYPAKEQTNASIPSQALNSSSSTSPALTSPAQKRPPSNRLARSGSQSPQSVPSSSSSPSPPSSPAALSPDLKQKLEELLVKYSSGLWAHALPKLFQDTYKVDMYKLVVLMGEMILYYNKTEERPLKVEKNLIYAAKIENKIFCSALKFVILIKLNSFFSLCLPPAGVKQRQWSEEASIVFRNHVEKKPLVAQLEAVQEAATPWDRKLTVFLVDTSQEERDIWVHDIMAEFADEPSNEL